MTLLSLIGSGTTRTGNVLNSLGEWRESAERHRQLAGLVDDLGDEQRKHSSLVVVL